MVVSVSTRTVRDVAVLVVKQQRSLMDTTLIAAFEAFNEPPTSATRTRDVAWCETQRGNESGELVGLLSSGAEHVAELLRVAREHSVAVERLLEADEILPVPMMSLVRSIHEALLEACWLSDPEVSCETRLARIASVTLASIAGNVAPLGQLPGGAAELPRVVGALKDAQALLQRIGFQLRYNKSHTSVTSVAYEEGHAPIKLNITDLNEIYMPGTEHTWTLGSGGTHSRRWFTVGLEGSRDQICVMVVGPILDSCDYVMDNILGYVGLSGNDFHARTHRRRTALLLTHQGDHDRGFARAGYREYDAERRRASGLRRSPARE